MNFARHLGLLGWAAAARLLPLIYGLAMVFVVMPAMPLEEFGRFNIAFSIFNFAAVLNRTLILQPMMRFAADSSQFDRMTRAGLGLSLSFCGGMVVLLLLASPLIASIQRVGVTEVTLAALLLPAFFFRDFGFFVQQTLYRSGRIFIIEAVFWLGASIGLVGGVMMELVTDARDALIVVGSAAVLSSVTALLLGSVKRMKAMKAKQEYQEGGTAKAAGVIVGYGLKTLPAGLAGSMLNAADVLAMGAIWTPREVAVYSGAKWVYRLAVSLPQAASMLVTPFAARLAAEKRRGELAELLEKSATYAVGVMSVVAVAGMALASPVFGILMGGRYAESAPILKGLLIGLPFDALVGIAGGVLYGMGFAGVVSWVAVGMIGALGLLLPLLIFSYGGVGCGLAMSGALAVGGTMMLAAAFKHTGTGFKPAVARLGRTLRHWGGSA